MTTDDSKTLNADEDYGFDVAGFLHIRDVLTAEQVEACNKAIDAMGQQDGILEWPPPHGEPFLALQNPVLQKYVEALCGPTS